MSNLPAENDIYVLYNDEFVKTTKGTIPANRCYLPVAKNSGAEARLSIFIDNEDTGIAVIETMRNVANEKFYNLSGQRVMNPAQGLYIVNGKKVVLK